MFTLKHISKETFACASGVARLLVLSKWNLDVQGASHADQNLVLQWNFFTMSLYH
jgi:hypothetical protein